MLRGNQSGAPNIGSTVLATWVSSHAPTRYSPAKRMTFRRFSSAKKLSIFMVRCIRNLCRPLHGRIRSSQPHHPGWNFQEREDLRGNLNQEPADNGVGDGNFVDVAPLQFSEEVLRIHGLCFCHTVN